jgi:hypothetical protein
VGEQQQEVVVRGGEEVVFAEDRGGVVGGEDGDVRGEEGERAALVKEGFLLGDPGHP